MEAAFYMSRHAKRVEILPTIHMNETKAREKIFPQYDRLTSNPDLRVDEEYWEVEHTMGDKARAVRQRCKRGLEQADNVFLWVDSMTHLAVAEKVLINAKKYIVKKRKPA